MCFRLESDIGLGRIQSTFRERFISSFWILPKCTFRLQFKEPVFYSLRDKKRNSASRVAMYLIHSSHRVCGCSSFEHSQMHWWFCLDSDFGIKRLAHDYCSSADVNSSLRTLHCLLSSVVTTCEEERIERFVHKREKNASHLLLHIDLCPWSVRDNPSHSHFVWYSTLSPVNGIDHHRPLILVQIHLHAAEEENHWSFTDLAARSWRKGQ